MTSLVIGGNGFLGSHLVRELLADGTAVRVLTRPTSDLRTIAGLDVDHVTGTLFDTDTLARALRGIDTVYHCAVDTRAWLRDSAPLYRTNVEALRSVLDAAVGAELDAFVFTSSMATIGRHPGRVVDETDEFNWESAATGYVRSRVAGERLALGYAARGRVPVSALCVSNTYGPGDVGPTPHGQFVAGAALGKLPFTVRGVRAECVAVDDAARALIAAARRGRPGERYIVSERFLDLGDVIATAARAAGRRPPRRVLPRPALSVAGTLGSAWAAVSGRSPQLTAH
ncbi:MAG: NAD-dependent epimerase/dehydratase family protein, partial [Gordonia sp. (in: high G+C Gram-positive bacteria)]